LTTKPLQPLSTYQDSEALGDPRSSSDDRVSSAFIGSPPVWLVGEQRVEAQDDSTVGAPLAKADT
jgi:hypothetical protein